MSAPKGENLTWHVGEVDKAARTAAHGHRGAVLWFTGLSGSGKSTIGHRVERMLIERGAFAYVLDGDNIRHGLNSDLGFAPEDRVENIRRIGEVARLFADAGALVVSAFISPYRKDRDRIRGLMGEGEFVEVFVDTPLEVCEARDPKGLYKKARAGEISNFTGLDAPYEAPERPEVHLLTADLSIDEAAAQVIRYLEQQNILGES
ncbi:MAG: adenylyl-sulfate kinase [Polyangiales bacterium]